MASGKPETLKDYLILGALNAFALFIFVVLRVGQFLGIFRKD